MKREEKIGAALGVAGGMLGLIFLAILYLINEEPKMEGMPVIVLTAIVGLFYSALFGRQAGKKILEHSPALVGLQSTALTNICTLLTLGIIGAVIQQDISLLFIAIYGFIFSFIVGGIPMLIIGISYGYALRRLVKSKY